MVAGVELMARIRTIKPELWVSEQIAECSPIARLTFIGIWNFCDDNGVHPAKPKTLKAELFPMDDFSAADLAEWVGELVRAGLVAEFTHQGVDFWHVTGWTKHQKIEKPSCKYPRPPTLNSANPPRKLPEDSPNAHRGPPPGEERKGEESKGEEKPNSPEARPAPDPASTGTRLPKDWSLPDDYRAYCVKERPDLDPDNVAENFRDHWHGVAGAKGRKADWLATWRGWVRRENERAINSTSSGRRSALHAEDMIGAVP
jgi:hypothetical protein